jgi:hypothetical protein
MLDPGWSNCVGAAKIRSPQLGASESRLAASIRQFNPSASWDLRRSHHAVHAKTCSLLLHRSACCYSRGVPTPADADLIEDLIEMRAQLSVAEGRVHRARIAVGSIKAAAIFLTVLLSAAITITILFASTADVGVMWGVVVPLMIVTGIGIAIVASVAPNEVRLVALRQHELALERLYDSQALRFSGREVPVDVRQYAFRGTMQRSILATRKSGDRYRRVNNSFQSVIIIGSLATTAVASLNTGEGALKWIAVGLSFTVGLSAGFTGYFKYRERAFYLRQTADDLEEQLNAYELGLEPYNQVTESERIGLLTARMESIRVAQQQREQQLDQPKAQSREG